MQQVGVERDMARVIQSPNVRRDNQLYVPSQSQTNAIAQQRMTPTAQSEEPTDDLEQVLWWQQALSTPFLSNDHNFIYLDLDQLVLSALTQSKKIRVAHLDKFIEQERVTQADSEFDWILFAENLFTDTNQKTGSDLDAGNGIAQLEQQEINSNTGIRRTNRRGGQFEAAQNVRLFDSNSQFINPPDQALTQLTVRYTQPLRREGGFLVNYGRVLQAQISADTTAAESQAEIADIIVEVVESYWQIYQLRSRYIVQYRQVKLLEELLSDLNRRAKIDAKRSLIGQAEAELASQTATLGQTSAQLTQAQLQLVRLVGDRQLGQFSEFIPTSHPAPPVQLPDSSSVVSLALKLRPEIRAALSRTQGSELFKQITYRQLLPKLALVLESSVNGVNGDFDVGRSLGDQYSKGAPTYSVGFNYEMPFGNRFAISRNREAEMRVAREVALFEDAVDQVTLEARTALSGLEGANDQFEVRADSIQKAKKVIESLTKRRIKFPEESDQVSQLYIREILEAQQRITQAESALIDLMFDYSKATIQLRQATGALVSGFQEAAPQCAPVQTRRRHFLRKRHARHTSYSQQNAIQNSQTQPSKLANSPQKQTGFKTNLVDAPPLNRSIPPKPIESNNRIKQVSFETEQEQIHFSPLPQQPKMDDR